VQIWSRMVSFRSYHIEKIKLKLKHNLNVMHIEKTYVRT
jgi:hypothetical protein